VNIKDYERFVDLSPQGTIFCTPWWLDTVAPGQYDILTVEKGGEIQAAWPVVFDRQRHGMTSIIMPKLTPWLGILYPPFPIESKFTTRLSTEKELAARLIEQAPNVDSLQIKCHRNFQYWSPFYWKGFSQTTRYTFVFDDLSDLKTIWNGMSKSVRWDINKAIKLVLWLNQSKILKNLYIFIN